MQQLRNDYQIIYADPPWSYKDKCNAGKRGAGYKYETMNLDQLTNLYSMVHTLSLKSENAVLFLWATWPLITDAIILINRWNFSYKTIGFIWIKQNKLKPTPFMGMGNWTRSNSEPCLIATKGNPKRISASVHSVIQSPIRAHSQKPDEARDRIVTLMGDVPRIEIFARQRVEGWDAWGNEI